MCLDQLIVESDGSVSLPGQVSFVSKEISDVFYLVLDHCWSLLYIQCEGYVQPDVDNESYRAYHYSCYLILLHSRVTNWWIFQINAGTKITQNMFQNN